MNYTNYAGYPNDDFIDYNDNYNDNYNDDDTNSSFNIIIIITVFLLLFVIISIIVYYVFLKKNKTEKTEKDTSQPTKNIGDSCNKTSDCKNGLVCLNNTCINIKKGRGESCSSDIECEIPYKCINGKCIEPSASQSDNDTNSFKCNIAQQCQSVLQDTICKLKDDPNLSRNVSRYSLKPEYANNKSKLNTFWNDVLISGTTSKGMDCDIGTYNPSCERGLISGCTNATYNPICVNGMCKMVSRNGQPSKNIGESCIFDYECKDRLCFKAKEGVQGTCVKSKLNEFDACTANIQCSKNMMCCDGLCKYKPDRLPQKYRDNPNLLDNYYGNNFQCFNDRYSLLDLQVPCNINPRTNKYREGASRSEFCDKVMESVSKLPPLPDKSSDERGGPTIVNNTKEGIDVVSKPWEERYSPYSLISRFVKPNETITGPSGHLKPKAAYIFDTDYRWGNQICSTNTIYIPVDSNTKHIKIDDSNNDYYIVTVSDTNNNSTQYKLYCNGLLNKVGGQPFNCNSQYVVKWEQACPGDWGCCNKCTNKKLFFVPPGGEDGLGADPVFKIKCDYDKNFWENPDDCKQYEGKWASIVCE